MNINDGYKRLWQELKEEMAEFDPKVVEYMELIERDKKEFIQQRKEYKQRNKQKLIHHIGRRAQSNG